MKKHLRIITMAVLVILLSVSLIGCGGGTSTPPSPSGGTEPDASAPAPAPISVTLIAADMTPANSSTAQMLEWWGTEVEKRTNGEVKCDFYWSGSLIGAYEQLEAVKTGNIDYTAYYSGYHPDLAPLPSICLMPMLNIGPLDEALPAVDELYRTNPAIQAEFAGNNVHYLFPVYVPDAYIWSTKKPINTVSDIKGLNFRAMSTWLAFFGELGAAPISLPLPEVYDALDRGAVDADILFLPNATGNSYWEVTPYVNATNLGANLGAPAVMNLDRWNSMPDYIQEIMEQTGKDAVARSIELNNELYARDMKLLEDHNMTIAKFSQEDMDTMKQVAMEKVWEPFIEDLESKGVAARDVLDTYLQLLDKYSK